MDEALALFAERQAATVQSYDQVLRAQARIEHEMATASRLDAPDSTVEAFMGWLPTGRAALANARLRLDRTEAELAMARTALNVARTDAMAIEKLMDERSAAQKSRDARRTQSELDELARQCRPRPLA